MLKILTHDGRFHTDDVVACMLIRLIEGEENVEVVRSRNLENIEQYKWVVDVGREYMPEFNRFDHHQEECNETWPGFKILLSSSGMVFFHYWKEILEGFGHENVTEKEATLIYKKLFLPIDAHDNGQLTKEYYLNWKRYDYGDGIKMGQVIADMNYDDVFDEKQMLRFKDAMKYSFDSLCPAISHIIKTYRSNNKMVELLKDADISSGVLVLPKGAWLNSYIRSQIDPNNKIYFTVYEKKEGVYGFSAVQHKRFTNRIDLVEEDKEKYSDLIFIHKKLFCGAASSQETAMQICLDSIKAHRKKRLYKGVIGAGVVGGIAGLYIFLKN